MRPQRALHSPWQPSNVVNERRSAPRHETQLEARLLFSVSLLDAKPGPSGAQSPLTLVGYTRNISETGLALIIPSIRIGDKYLNVVNSQLRILLDLPIGPIQIHATPVRCERLDEKGYLLGVRITKMNDSEWVRLVKYLYMLR